MTNTVRRGDCGDCGDTPLHNNGGNVWPSPPATLHRLGDNEDLTGLESREGDCITVLQPSVYNPYLLSLVGALLLVSQFIRNQYMLYLFYI